MIETVEESKLRGRYEAISKKKVGGETYTPKMLADFVAKKIIEYCGNFREKKDLRFLDPAVGDGELLISLLNCLPKKDGKKLKVCGYETDGIAIETARRRLTEQFKDIPSFIEQKDFLKTTLEEYHLREKDSLFYTEKADKFDIVIANPPYVRTQVLGAERARELSKAFGLKGRVDLYHAFIIAISEVLNTGGMAGIIVSNRFMTTKAGASIRRAIRERFEICHVWDLGDTKLFDVAVLPAIMILQKKEGVSYKRAKFTSIYETSENSNLEADTVIDALNLEGLVQVQDGRKFRVQTGKLNDVNNLGQTWRITTKSSDSWLLTVKNHTWGDFKDIGKIRVGVKTCADKVFIRSDWDLLSDEKRPELLKPLTTHHIAHRFRALCQKPGKYIIYPHEVNEGRRSAINLEDFPKTRAYLEQHRDILEKRDYLLDAGRKWYEIWVPQDPSTWIDKKLVFRDIADKPVFWIDEEGTIVNGDCYWIIPENRSLQQLLWLAAGVGNSTFIESFYDHSFHNKLYAGRRRFMTQYVEKFPLPDPKSKSGKEIIILAKKIYQSVGTPREETLSAYLDEIVWEAFGLTSEKVIR